MILGMLGGSFNPLHNSHIGIAKAAMDGFALDRVLFMVAKDPPHKTIADGVDALTRFEMTAKGLGGDGLFASDLELKRDGKSYTVDTIAELGRLYPGARLMLIIGADMLLDFPSWRDPTGILQRAEIIAVARPGVIVDRRAAAMEIETRFGGRVYVAPFSGEDLSSTDIRERVRLSQPINALTPPGTERYIYEKGLYLDDADGQMLDMLRASISPRRFAHSVGTAREAISLAGRFGADGHAARTAALLHDCGKTSREGEEALAKALCIEPDAQELRAPALLHGRIGAALAREKYGVWDEAVLHAIAVHTRCCKQMSLLDKIVYLADKIEPTRDYEGVDTLRAAAADDIDTAVIACIDSITAHLSTLGREAAGDMAAARENILKEIEKQEEQV